MSIPNECIIVGGGKSIQDGLNQGLGAVLRGKFVILSNYAYKHFEGSFLTFIDHYFYKSKDIARNPDIYEELKQLPLIIGINHDSVDKVVHPNTILVKKANNYQRENGLQNGFYCYDNKTEILTDQGWKYFKDLDKTEKVATLNINKDLVEYHIPIKYHTYNYNGLMVHEQGKRLDLLVTPNHNMLIKKGHNQKTKSKKLYFVKAKNLPKTDVMYKKYFPLIIENSPKYFVLPSLINNCKTKNYKSNASYYKNKLIKMSHWLEFLGWFISEGCTYKSKKREYFVCISQSKFRNIIKIRNCLKKCNFKFYEAKQNKNITFRILNKQLYCCLKSLGKSKNKYIPRDFLNLNKKFLNILFKSLILGDGSKNNKTFSYYTSSKQLANDVFELGLKLEYSPTLNVRTKHGYKINGTVSDKKFISYEVFFAKTKYTVMRNKQRKQIKYNGKIYCVEVPNHAIYVRRNGKSCWCGNSGNLTGIFALNLASFLMDYEGKIYLLGFDWSINKNEQTHYYTDIKHRGISLIKWYQHNNPDKYFMIFIEDKLKIYNVSPTSNIDVFEKISYSTFYKLLNNQTYNQEELRKGIKKKLNFIDTF